MTDPITGQSQEDALSWLQRWYGDQCDDDWEHTYGVRIDTLDNPGWSLDVDLKGTAMEQRPFESLSIDRSETDWVRCRVEAAGFRGAGGPGNLSELIAVFREWVQAGGER